MKISDLLYILETALGFLSPACAIIMCSKHDSFMPFPWYTQDRVFWLGTPCEERGWGLYHRMYGIHKDDLEHDFDTATKKLYESAWKIKNDDIVNFYLKRVNTNIMNLVELHAIVRRTIELIGKDVEVYSNFPDGTVSYPLPWTIADSNFLYLGYNPNNTLHHNHANLRSDWMLNFDANMIKDNDVKSIDTKYLKSAYEKK